MIPYLDRSGEAGQSLIELIVVMPVLLLLLATVFPLLASGTVTPWLDEKLWLRQGLQRCETLQPGLEHTREKSLIPRYFRQSDLEETTSQEKLGFSFPLLGDSFPGTISVKKVLANHPEGTGTTLGKTERSGEKIPRSFAMLASAALAEPDIPPGIRKLSVIGISPWKTGTMKNLGFELFHLNLDALPEEDH